MNQNLTNFKAEFTKFFCILSDKLFAEGYAHAEELFYVKTLLQCHTWSKLQDIV